MPCGPLGLVWGRLIGCMGRQMEVGGLAARPQGMQHWGGTQLHSCSATHGAGGGGLGADPHCLHPTGRLWVRAAHLPPVRQVLPGGPAAFLYGGFRHRCRHLPEGGGNLPTPLPSMGSLWGRAHLSPLCFRLSPRTRWSGCRCTTSRRGGTTRPARRQGIGACPAPNPRTPPPTVCHRVGGTAGTPTAPALRSGSWGVAVGH